MFSNQVRRYVFKQSVLKTFQAPFSTAALQRHEFFVVVWNHPGAEQVPAPKVENSLSSQSFAGDILDTASSEKVGNSVRGSTFTCKAASVEDVIGKLANDPRVKQGIWDLSTVMISPFETVLTSNLKTLDPGAKDFAV